MAMVNPQSLTRLDSSSPTTKGAVTLNPGESLQGTVKQVSQDQLTPQVFKIKVESQSRLMELQTRQPIAQGSQVTVARDNNGNLTVNIQNQVSAPNTSSTQTSTTTVQTPPNPASSTTRVPATPVPTTGQTPTALSQQLNQLVPTGSSTTVTVLQQTPLATNVSASASATATLVNTAPQNGAASTAANAQTGGTRPTQPTNSQQTTTTAVNSSIPANSGNSAVQAPSGTQSQAAPTQPTGQPATPQTINSSQTGAGSAPSPSGAAQSTNSTTATGPTQSPAAPPSAGTPAQPLTAQAARASTPTAHSPVPPTITHSTAAASASSAAPASTPTHSSATTVPTRTPTVQPAPGNTATSPAPQNTANSSYTTPAGQQLTVNIKGQTLQLQTTANLPPLKEVTLERPSQQQLTISWPNPPAPSAKTTALDNMPLTPSQQQAVSQTMRESLPVQRPLAESLQQLANTQTQPNTSVQSQTNAPGIDKAIQSILQLFSVTPGSQDAEQSIRQNLQLGGLFTENRLANQQPVNQDMKQFLGKLDAMADQLPAAQRDSIKSAVESMMSRITQQQITQVQHRQDRTDTTERFYQLDLPVHFQEALDNVEMRLQQRDSQNEYGQWETLWRIRLHFELGEDGMIDADVSLNESTQAVSALFACSETSTANRVRGQLDEFSQRLAQLGFESSSLTCRQGNIAAQSNPIQKQLIDIKT